ncbi:MAG TPA: TIR domain-containing protein [Nitrososphaera sp.]|jgi:uncharacterized protein YegP (UPF0339 family)|nr:TIR domain-containing protein [Nitrososphaera sp.]
MKYYIFKDAAGLWRWHITDESNRILATSAESYHSKAECERAINLLFQKFMDSVEISAVKLADNANEPQHALSAFLCHASNDKPKVQIIHQELSDTGIEPWIDEQNLMPGQDWNQEIRKAVRSCDVVIVCLSQKSVSKTGYVQKEIKYALDVADEQPEGTIFLIPLRLEECDIPERLRRWHWVDYFQEKGYEQLMKALRFRAEQLGRKIPSAN